MRSTHGSANAGAAFIVLMALIGSQAAMAAEPAGSGDRAPEKMAATAKRQAAPVVQEAAPNDAARRQATRTTPVQLMAPAIEIVNPATAEVSKVVPAAPSAGAVPPTESVPASAQTSSVTVAGGDASARPPGARSSAPLRSGQSRAHGTVINVNPLPPIDVNMAVGESRLVRGLKSSRVVVGTDKIVTAVVLEDRQVMLFGNAPGSTTMQVWDTANVMRTFKVTIAGANDTERVAREIKEFLAEVPGLRVRTLGDKIFVDGSDLSDEVLHSLEVLAKQFDKVVNLTENQKNNGGWDRMVMLDIKVVEFKNRERLRDLGVLWGSDAAGPRFGIGGDIKSSLTRNGDNFVVQPDGSIAAVAAGATLAPFRSYFGFASALASRLKLLATDGEAVILAEPQLAARSGRSAAMHVGGRIPIIVPGGVGGPGTVTQERYGVKLSMTPTIGRDNSIQAKVSAELSEPDATVSINGISGFKERMVETVFNVSDGQTMVLSGLIQRRRENSVQKVPLLGDIPLLGHAFRSSSDKELESEVVIFVTAKIVDPSHNGVVKTIDATQKRIDTVLGPRVEPKGFGVVPEDVAP